MSLDIIVDNTDQEEQTPKQDTKDDALVAWVMARVQPWIDHRDTNFKERWDEYERLFRGIYSAQDKLRQSERSKLITPALQQAVEVAVAEIEEATFGKGTWFDIADDVKDKLMQQNQDVEGLRKLLDEDFEEANVKSAMSEVFLNSALYGTGIGKIIVEEKNIKKMLSDDFVQENSKKVVKLAAVDPRRFFIDTAATNIDEALGCGEQIDVPIHNVINKMKAGIYKKVSLGSYIDTMFEDQGTTKPVISGDKVYIIEYHGLVPSVFVPADEDLVEDEEIKDLLEMSDVDEENIDEFELVEAIVTIANEGVLLRVVKNPLTMEDRSFIAYQHDTVPNRFWGRGVAEKGFHMQKALDAETRARIDAMALTIHPMMGVDATRLPRGVDLSVRPGKSILTQGDPATILRPLNFGQVSPSTFHQSGDLERMLQMGTGSMDSATPTGISPRNSTASGMSMILSGAIKRSKRTLANIERHFTSPFVHKAMWRYMQFDSERYPVMDVKFRVFSTLGIMAREVEQQQLSSLLNTVPPDSPAYWMLIRSIYENSSITNKDEMLPLIDQLLQQSLQPKQDPMAQIKQQELQHTMQMDMARLQIEHSRAQTEAARVTLEAQKSPSEIAKKQAETMLALAKAEAEKAGMQLDAYKAYVDTLLMGGQSQTKGVTNGTSGTGNV